MHRQFQELWDALPERVGLESAQQFYDHVAWTPGEPPGVGRTTFLRGKSGRATEGFSRVIHYEISGAGRLNFRYHDAYDKGRESDPHQIVQIMTIDLSSHWPACCPRAARLDELFGVSAWPAYLYAAPPRKRPICPGNLDGTRGNRFYERETVLPI